MSSRHDLMSNPRRNYFSRVHPVRSTPYFHMQKLLPLTDNRSGGILPDFRVRNNESTFGFIGHVSEKSGFNLHPL